jgi:hypothetical protein
MPYTETQRQEYNKKYYAEKKNEILGKILAKVECPFCKSQVAKNYIDTHKLSSICKRKEEKRIVLQQRLSKINNVV